MASVRTANLLRHLRQFAAERNPAAPADRELVQRFAERADEGAFAALLARHGPMVLRVCRRVLPNAQDAEDAVQATFLVLARKAGCLRRRESVGNWLYGVAYRVALNARAAAARRAAHEGCAPPPAAVRDPLAEVTVREAQALLDEELARLPERYRTPLVLCCLEGLARDEAARQLGWPTGTLKGRLERGRALLRARLTRRGLTLPAAFTAAFLGQDLAQAALPRATMEGSLGCVAKAAAGPASPSPAALALADGVLHAMAAARLKAGAALLLAVGILTAGVGLLAAPATPPSQPGPQQPTAAGALKPEAAKSPSPRLDRYGDPLPEEAIARLGTMRLRHGDFVTFLRFTPDGKTLVSQAHDGVRVWDAATGKQRRFFPRETSNSFGADASLSTDGKWLAMPAKSGVGIWELGTGKLLRTVGVGPYARPCFSPDGKSLAAYLNDRSDDGRRRIVLWDAATGREQKTWDMSPWVEAIAFTPDGKRLILNSSVTGERGFFILIWDVGTGKEQRRFEIPSRSVPHVALSPDGTLLAAIHYRDPEPGEPEFGLMARAGVWDISAEQAVLHLPLTAKGKGAASPQYLRSLAFAPDGKTLYAGGVDGQLIGWDPRTGKEVRRVGHDLPQPFALAFTPDGKTVAANLGPLVRLIDLASGADRFPALKEPRPIKPVAITPDGRTVVTAEPSGLSLWDAASGREVRRLEGKHFAPIVHLARDSRTLLTSDEGEGGDVRTLQVWDLASGKELQRVERRGKRGTFLRAISPDGKTLVLARWGAGISLIDWQTGKELRDLPGNAGPASGTAFTADGRTLVGWDGERRVRRWDVATGRLLQGFDLPQDLNEGRSFPYSAAISPDGRYLIFGSQNRFLVLFDLTTGEEIWKLDPLPANPMNLAIASNGRTLAWGGFGGDGLIRLVETASGRQRHQLVGHRGRITSLAFAANGTTLVSASADTTALVWDLTGRLGAKAAWGKPLTVAELDADWAALAAADAPRAYQAVRRLAASPAEAVPYLQAHLRPVPAADAKRAAGLIRDLESARFAVRDRAAKELEKLGDSVTGPCRKALAASPALEVRRRLEVVLKSHRQTWRAPGPDRLRALRALEALERAGTAEARQVLARLARGAAEARLTQEARASLRRLDGPGRSRPGAGPHEPREK